MAEPTATGFVKSLTGQFQDNINKAKESATSAAMGHFGKIGDELGSLKKKNNSFFFYYKK